MMIKNTAKSVTLKITSSVYGDMYIVVGAAQEHSSSSSSSSSSLKIFLFFHFPDKHGDKKSVLLSLKMKRLLTFLLRVNSSSSSTCWGFYPSFSSVSPLTPPTTASQLTKFKLLISPIYFPFAVNSRRYSSDFDPFDSPQYTSTCIEANSNGDKLYKTVVDHSLSYYDMEGALDNARIELSTELVLDVLHRLRFEEKLAFRFFTWAGHQHNYAHEPGAYNEMIDILSTTRYKIKQFRIVCDLLDYMKRHSKNAVPVEVILVILRNYTEKHLNFLHKFAKKKRVRVKTQPEINAFNLLLDALCKCSLVNEAEVMFKKVKKKIKPDSNTYNILFFGWCRVRNPKRGMKVLEEMIELGLTPDSFTYNTAIDTFCKAGMVDEARGLFEFMRKQGSTMSSPTAKTYTILIGALVENNKMGECFRLLEIMINSGCLPDVTTYKEVIEGMCLAGKVEEAYMFLDEMGKKGYPPDIVTYNCFLKVLSDNKMRDDALKLYDRMLESGCVPSVQSYNMLISMFFELGNSEGAFETWREMDKRGCARDSDTYCVMIEGLFSCNMGVEACGLVEEVVNRGMKLPYQKFDSFLTRLSMMGNLQAIHRLSEHMRKFYNPFMARRFALNQKRRSMRLRGSG